LPQVENFLKQTRGLVSKETVVLGRKGSVTPNFWIHQPSLKGKLATVKGLKADVSSISPYRREIHCKLKVCEEKSFGHYIWFFVTLSFVTKLATPPIPNLSASCRIEEAVHSAKNRHLRFFQKQSIHQKLSLKILWMKLKMKNETPNP